MNSQRERHPGGVGIRRIQKIMVLIVVEIILGLNMLGSSPIGAEVHETKLVADDGTHWDEFGISVSISGNTLVAGAYWDDVVGFDSGSVYIFERVGGSWVQKTKLVPSDARGGDRFGHSVSIDKDTIVIGADGVDFAGAAYVFRRNGGSWIEEAKLQPKGGAVFGLFGRCVSVSGDIIVVGAPSAPPDIGYAYVFEREGNIWAPKSKLGAGDATRGNCFGFGVAVSNGIIVVGARYNDGADTQSGAAYVFQEIEGRWKQTAKLIPSDGTKFDFFGESVSIDEDIILIGAKQDCSNGQYSGSAYVFIRNGGSWFQNAKLVGDPQVAHARFGYSVSIHGDNIAVGARYDNDPGHWAGSAYWFQRNGSTWDQKARVYINEAKGFEQFGTSVSISDTTMVVGAPGDEEKGAVYVYELVPPTAITASVDIDPDTINLRSRGKWITGYITLPEGYDVNDIVIDTVLLEDRVPADWGDVQANTLMVKFPRRDVVNVLSTGKYNLKVTGELIDGTIFEGYSDDITVINPP